MTPAQAKERIDWSGKRNPVALALARLLSFAALADPALIRGMRLNLLPSASAADEADLWFSNLVQSKSSSGLVFFAEVSVLLRQNLSPELRDKAWNYMEAMHRNQRRVLRIEEELAYLGLEPEKHSARITELLRAVLGGLIAGRSELANWAGRALPRLSTAVQSTDSASVLAIASDFRLGRNPNLQSRLSGSDTMPTWMAAMLPKLNRVRLAVTLTDRDIVFGPAPPSAADSQTIEVPDTPTVPLEICWKQDGVSHSKLVFVESGQTSHPCSTDADFIDILTLANETWNLCRNSSSSRTTEQTVTSVRALTDGYAVLLHWAPRPQTAGCLGFAIERRLLSGDASQGSSEPEVLFSVNFSQPDVSSLPTTRSPVQRFSYVDKTAPRAALLSYRVIPVEGNPNDLRVREELASSWSAPVRTGLHEAPVSVAFNRPLDDAVTLGVPPVDVEKASFDTFLRTIAHPEDAVRRALGADLLSALRSLLADALKSRASIFVAMFEFNDTELIDLLAPFGYRASVILSQPSGAQDKNKNVQTRSILLRSGVRVLDRRPTSEGLIHNKFLIVCDEKGRPQTVWTGNVSWLTTALCMRSNAAVTIRNPPLAAAYLDCWHRLATSDKLTPAVLRLANSSQRPRVPVASGTTVQPWFTPANDHIDIKAAADLVARATQGVLFLLSEPGKRASLLDVILKQPLFRLGAVREGPALTLLRNDQRFPVTGNHNALPVLRSVSSQKAPRLPMGISLQTRMIVIDPFGSKPVVLIGSHAFGDRGSHHNDENFVVIEGDSELAGRCAAHIDLFFQHYRVSTRMGERPGSVGLRMSEEWQNAWLTPEMEIETAFWMAEDIRPVVPLPVEVAYGPSPRIVPSKQHVLRSKDPGNSTAKPTRRLEISISPRRISRLEKAMLSKRNKIVDTTAIQKQQETSKLRSAAKKTAKRPTRK